MRLCVICRFETTFDDVAIPHTSGRCICLRCYSRETERALPMPKRLRRELSSTLADADAA